MNHTRLPKEKHLPYWARRGNKDKKGDRVESVSRLTLTCLEPFCLMFGTILSDVWNHSVWWLEPFCLMFGTILSDVWNHSVWYVSTFDGKTSLTNCVALFCVSGAIVSSFFFLHWTTPYLLHVTGKYFEFSDNWSNLNRSIHLLIHDKWETVFEDCKNIWIYFILFAIDVGEWHYILESFHVISHMPVI